MHPYEVLIEWVKETYPQYEITSAKDGGDGIDTVQFELELCKYLMIVSDRYSSNLDGELKVTLGISINNGSGYYDLWALNIQYEDPSLFNKIKMFIDGMIKMVDSFYKKGIKHPPDHEVMFTYEANKIFKKALNYERQQRNI